MTKTRSPGLAWLYDSSSDSAWSRSAVLPLPFSPKTSAVDGIGRTAEELVPRRMVDRRQTAPLEHGIRLGILLAERIAGDPMVPQELFQLHPWQCLSCKVTDTLFSIRFVLPNSVAEGNRSRLTVSIARPVRCDDPRAQLRGTRPDETADRELMERSSRSVLPYRPRGDLLIARFRLLGTRRQLATAAITRPCASRRPATFRRALPEAHRSIRAKDGHRR